MKYIIALDQGTTSSRVALVDEQENITAILSREFPQIYPDEGWVEHDPIDIWSSQYGVMMELLAKCNVAPSDIVGMGHRRRIAHAPAVFPYGGLLRPGAPRPLGSPEGNPVYRRTRAGAFQRLPCAGSRAPAGGRNSALAAGGRFIQ